MLLATEMIPQGVLGGLVGGVGPTGTNILLCGTTDKEMRFGMVIYTVS